jgi:hypothetical protein
MSASELLDGGFRLFRATLVRCLPWSMLAVLCGQAPRALDVARGRIATGLPPHDAMWWSLTAVGGLLNVLFFGVLLLRQEAIAYGHRDGLRGQLWRLLRGAPGYLLMALIWWAPMILLGAAIGAGWWGTSIALALPAAYLTLAWWFAAYESLLQLRSPLAALRSSRALMRRQWWRTLGVLSISVVVLLVLYALGGIAAVLLAQLLASADLALLSVITTVTLAMVAAIYLPLLVALGHTMYADLLIRQRLGHAAAGGA